MKLHVENIALLATEKVILRKYCDKGIDALGNYYQGECIDKDITANIQPLTGYEIQQLVNYDASRESLTIYSKEVLTTDNEVIRNGKEYEVNRVEAWGEYFKAVLVEKRPSA